MARKLRDYDAELQALPCYPARFMACSYRDNAQLSSVSSSFIVVFSMGLSGVLPSPIALNRSCVFGSVAVASNAGQSSGGLPLASMRPKIAYGSVPAPALRSV